MDEPIPEPKYGCCLQIVKDQLASYHKADVELKLSTFINTATFEQSFDLPPLFYTIGHGRKRVNGNIAFRFCPFCGKPIR